MELAVVVEQFDGPCPAGRFAHHLVRHLVGRGHVVTVITGAYKDAESWPEVDFAAMSQRILRWPWQPLRFARFARRQLASGRFDLRLSLTTLVRADLLVLVEGTEPERLERTARSTGPMISGLRTRVGGMVNPAGLYRRRAERRTLGRGQVRRIVAPSQYVERQLQTHFAVDSQRITVVQPGSPIVRPSDSQRRTWCRRLRQAFDIDDEALVFVFPDSDHAVHGLMTALDAVWNLQNQGVKLVLMLVGGVGFGVHEMVTRRELHEQVRIVGHTRELAGLYAAADVAVFPSAYDPVGRVVVDWLRMGLPGITSEYCGAAPLLRPELGDAPGLVLDDPSDAQALAQAMAELADPGQRAAYAKAAAEYDVESLAINKQLNQLETLIAELAANDG